LPRAEARDKKKKGKAYSARINPCPFKTPRKASFSAACEARFLSTALRHGRKHARLCSHPFANTRRKDGAREDGHPTLSPTPGERMGTGLSPRSENTELHPSDEDLSLHPKKQRRLFGGPCRWGPRTGCACNGGYSSRSRISGSTANARRAGIHAATRPSSSMVAVTPTKTTGSFGVAW
jgi:hypothetical protein